MKTACLLFAIVGFGMPLFGIAFAAQPSNQPSGQSSSSEPKLNPTTNDHPADSGHDNQTQTSGTEDQTDIKRPPPNAERNTPEKISQAGSAQLPSKQPPVKNPPKTMPSLDKVPVTAKGGFPVTNPGSNSAQLNKSPMTGKPALLVPAAILKPAGPTASIGGLAPSSVKTSTVGINGTEIKRTTPR